MKYLITLINLFEYDNIMYIERKKVMQNITVAFLIYVLLSSGAINKLIGLLANIKILRRLGIENYTLTNCLTVFRSRLILGSFKFESVLGIIIYVGGALWLTCKLYKSRELEF